MASGQASTKHRSSSEAAPSVRFLEKEIEIDQVKNSPYTVDQLQYKSKYMFCS